MFISGLRGKDMKRSILGAGGQSSRSHGDEDMERSTRNIARPK